MPQGRALKDVKPAALLDDNCPGHPKPESTFDIAVLLEQLNRNPQHSWSAITASLDPALRVLQPQAGRSVPRDVAEGSIDTAHPGRCLVEHEL